MVRRITPKILEQAKSMRRAWIESCDTPDLEWIEKEVASMLGVSYEALLKKL